MMLKQHFKLVLPGMANFTLCPTAGCCHLAN